jgi:hypothetical protein
MVQLLLELRAEASDVNPYLGDSRARMLRGLAKSNAAKTAMDRLQLHHELGNEELRLGNESEAVEHLRESRRMLATPEIRARTNRATATSIIFDLGVAYMRMAETRNCCQRHTADSCILPIRAEGIHTDKEPAEQAARCFAEVLQNLPPDAPLHLSARWLLNIAHMTLGNYPDGVPADYLIPPQVFESEDSIPRFRNIAPQLGVDTFSLCGGAIADDFDSDGYIDLVVSSWDPAEPVRFFRNRQDGTFTEQTDAAGLRGICGGLNLVQADYDNDGDTDFLVLRGGWWSDAGKHPNSLVQNDGEGTFTDVTFRSGLGDVHYPTQTGSWADYDLDGDLDLYIGNESTEKVTAPSQLFRNEGDGTFSDVAGPAGLTNDRFSKAVVWGDYDCDRFPDLYVSNLRDENRLYRNNGDGTFTDVAGPLGVAEPQASFPAWFWDLNSDGVLDLYVSSYSAGIAEIAASCLGQPFHTELARLYLGDGEGDFEEVAEAYNLSRPTSPMGSNFGDLDGDGYLDFYLGTGDPLYRNLMPNVMYRNQEGKRFADVTTAGGFGHLQKGHAVVFADFDRDGDQDVFEQMGGALPGDRYKDVLYENPGFANHWLAIELSGITSDRSAIGARIVVQVVESGERRDIYKHVNSGGTFGGNPLEQILGLGRAEEIAALEIFWPTTGRTQRFENVPLDTRVRIREGDPRLEVTSPRKLTLGGTVAAGDGGQQISASDLTRIKHGSNESVEN